MDALVMIFYAALIACCVSVSFSACVCIKMENLAEKNNKLLEENAMLRDVIGTGNDEKSV